MTSREFPATGGCRRHPRCGASQGAVQGLDEFCDRIFVAAVEDALTDTLGTDQASSLQGREMSRYRRLGQARALELASADAVDASSFGTPKNSMGLLSQISISMRAGCASAFITSSRNMSPPIRKQIHCVAEVSPMPSTGTCTASVPPDARTRLEAYGSIEITKKEGHRKTRAL